MTQRCFQGTTQLSPNEVVRLCEVSVKKRPLSLRALGAERFTPRDPGGAGDSPIAEVGFELTRAGRQSGSTIVVSVFRVAGETLVRVLQRTIARAPMNPLDPLRRHIVKKLEGTDPTLHFNKC